jgi:ABC-type glycerol-3-phosphate transport system substrate-binding protein
MKLVAAMAVTALLAGCGGGGGGQASAAADACEAYAKSQLGDKTYTLDKAALAKSMIAAADGSNELKGPIVIDPGTSSESKQTLECSVRFVAGKDTPDVLKMQFIW